MSIRCNNTNYLEASSDAGANTYSFMRHAWAYMSEINLFTILASGTGGIGLNLGPMGGKLISELILDDKPSLPLDKYRYSRFNKLKL